MTTWSREHIDRIREATDITAVAGEHVRLKKAGRVFKGLCPFHKEKTPSFVVNPDRQIYKCFGCGEGGDVYRLLMELEHLDFPEVVELLASRAGIALPKRWHGAGDESVYPVLEWAAEFYRGRLESPAGAGARNYLEQRGIVPEIWKRFGVGLAPGGWTGLLDQAKSRFSTQILERAGLVVSSDQGRRYDRFRGRLMIPIRSALGKTIAFGARALADEEPKYLNSPETETFVKGKVLYGLPEAKESLRETGFALVVEGYMDVIALAQAGNTNVVAASGTSLTEGQARILRRYVERAVLVFDGDEAGRRAAWKAAGVFLGEGFETRVLTLPQGEDPDSFVRTKGADAFAEALRKAPGVVEYARDELLGTLKREEILRAFAYLGARMDDRIRRTVLLEQAANAFRFELSELKDEVAKLRREARPADQERPAVKEGRDAPGRAYITLLLTEPVDPGAMRWVPETVFHESRLKELYGRVRELIEVEGDTHPKTQILSDPQHRDFAAELLTDDSVGGSDIDYVWARLMERDRKQRALKLWTAIRDAEARGDQETAQELLRQLNTLRQ